MSCKNQFTVSVFCCVCRHPLITRQWCPVYRLNLSSAATVQTALSSRLYHWHQSTNTPTSNQSRGSPLSPSASVNMSMWMHRGTFASTNIWMSTVWKRMSITASMGITAVKKKGRWEPKNGLLILLIKDHLRLNKTRLLLSVIMTCWDHLMHNVLLLLQLAKMKERVQFKWFKLTVWSK